MTYSIQVPASSANLGPGFDQLGLALGKYLKVRGERAADWRIETRGEGADRLPKDAQNLIARTIIDVCGDQGYPIQPMHLIVDNQIPVERGLGSSSTAIVAGVIMAQLLNDAVDKDRAFALAAELEGHPDNVGPAIYGGLQICGGRSGDWWAKRGELHRAIRVVVAIPREAANTEQMRGLLPASYTEAQEAETREAVAMLLEGLATGDAAKLRASEHDVKHQPYRFPALPISHNIYQRFQHDPAVAGAFLSGAGPTVAGWFFEWDRADVERLAGQVEADLAILPVDVNGVVWRKA